MTRKSAEYLNKHAMHLVRLFMMGIDILEKAQIRTHRPEEYLRIDPMKDVIEWQLDEVLDINGWDLKKALLAFGKGNPNIMEWANSPIIYRKAITEERDLNPQMPVIIDFIQQECIRQKQISDEAPDDHRRDFDELNEAFRAILKIKRRNRT